MKKIEGFDEYRALVDVVKMHDYRYFGLNNPTISDEEYDAMYSSTRTRCCPTHLPSNATARTATASVPWHVARLASP